MASGEVVLQAMMMVRGDEVAPVRLAELQAAVDGDGRAQGVGGVDCPRPDPRRREG